MKTLLFASLLLLVACESPVGSENDLTFRILPAEKTIVVQKVFDFIDYQQWEVDRHSDNLISTTYQYWIEGKTNFSPDSRMRAFFFIEPTTDITTKLSIRMSLERLNGDRWIRYQYPESQVESVFDRISKSLYAH